MGPHWIPRGHPWAPLVDLPSRCAWALGRGVQGAAVDRGRGRLVAVVPCLVEVAVLGWGLVAQARALVLVSVRRRL